ncbi:Crp/Fnr family transcriptional regulator [Paenibacillus sp. URB8-2]|uniref:Crp/Fnr family transcriptional regulator n=1 Tax=Paenibacillus sp. URB8-2 TaxID=2741301 RepID=UPI0015BD96D9|nr:Crp/Fnr family transcriptional regulator [Paenibacillus sp. URB8-2]BCG56755.1 cAMP-binding protein [Paenibacillus sp. URB8-2]
MFESVLDIPMFNIQNIDVELVLSMFTERHYAKDNVIFWQGDPGLEMYVIKSGSLKIFRQIEGKELILGHQFPGETIGELETVHANYSRLASVAALEKTVLWMIRKPDLETLIDLYPQILRKLFYVVSERLDQADRKLEYLAFLSSRIRVANLLLDLHSNFGVETPKGYLINWKVTHQHLAFMIGVSRESVTIALQELQTEQILSVKNKYITITNLAALKHLAQDDQDSTYSREWHPSSKYSIN